MTDLTRHESPTARPSLVIAEALVERYGPSQIASKADRLGLPRPLTRAIFAACCSTALDKPGVRPVRFAPTH